MIRWLCFVWVCDCVIFFTVVNHNPLQTRNLMNDLRWAPGGCNIDRKRHNFVEEGEKDCVSL